MTRRPRRPIAFFMLGLAFLGLAIASSVTYWGEITLLLNGQTSTATVVAFQETHGRQHTFQVRYRFRVDPTGPAYSHFDPTAGSDAYAQVNEQAWREAGANKGVLVRYNPHDPWHNHPAASPIVTEHLWFWVSIESALVLAALGLFGWFAVRISRKA